MPDSEEEVNFLVANYDADGKMIELKGFFDTGFLKYFDNKATLQFKSPLDNYRIFTTDEDFLPISE